MRISGCTIVVRLLLVAAAMLFSTCAFDKGLGPLQSRISGKITYLFTNLRPTNVDEVRVAALLKFPPTGLGDVFFSEPIDYLADTTHYELLLPEGHYPAVVLLWKPKGDSWSFNSLLGVYGFSLAEADLKPITIASPTHVIDDVDILALWNFAGADSKMNGRITFRGQVPSDTQALLLAAFTQMPNFDNVLASLLFLGGLPLPVSATQPNISYQLRLFHGNYKFIGLFWKGVDTPLEEMKLIGFYRDPADPDKPGEVSLQANQNLFDINFEADFNTLPDGIRP